MTAQERMTDALLRGAGGRTVLLHLPAPAVPGDQGEQLGLASVLFEDVALGPAVFRRVRAKTGTSETPDATSYELLISATAVKAAAGTLGMDAASLLFAEAQSVLVDGVAYAITWVTTAEAFGTVYVYRLGLRGMISNVT